MPTNANFLRYNKQMKKTVGELVKEKAIADGIDPELIERALKPLGPTLASISRLTKDLEGPMKTVMEARKSIQPQLDAISKIKLPVIPEMPELPDFSMPSYLPSSLYDEDGEFTLPEMVRPVQEVRIVNPEDIARANTKLEKDYLIGSYPLPPHASWESLDIQFIDGHFVKVSYLSMESKKFDYKDMGFINMKTTKPDLKWELLKAIADHGGALTNAKWERKFGRNVKYELNEGLKRFFGMKTNPIPHYTKKHGYKPLFTIRAEK